MNRVILEALYLDIHSDLDHFPRSSATLLQAPLTFFPPDCPVTFLSLSVDSVWKSGCSCLKNCDTLLFMSQIFTYLQMHVDLVTCKRNLSLS